MLFFKKRKRKPAQQFNVEKATVMLHLKSGVVKRGLTYTGDLMPFMGSMITYLGSKSARSEVEKYQAFVPLADGTFLNKDLIEYIEIETADKIEEWDGWTY